MENASKALIIAGAVLLAMMIVSLGIIIFNNMGNSVKNDTSLQQEEIASFNSKITPYVGNNKSGSQVKALIQYVRSVDQHALISEEDDGRVSIYYGSGTSSPIVEFRPSDTVITEKRENANSVETNKYYKVSVHYASNGLIDIINVE